MKKALKICSNNWKRNWLLSLSLFFSAIASSPAQIYLQIEQINNPKTLKIQIQQELVFKLKAYPESWRTQKIFDILPKENVIVFDENFFNPQDISVIQFKRQWAKAIGYKMMQFSAAYYLYGGIISLADPSVGMTKKQIAIGGGMAAGGYLLKSLFYKKNIRLGKNFNLRIVDLRFQGS